MIDSRFNQRFEAAVLAGFSVAQIEKLLGISNRNVRRLKAAMYEAGVLPKPTGAKPKDNHADHNRD
jgi:transposase